MVCPYNLKVNECTDSKLKPGKFNEHCYYKLNNVKYTYNPQGGSSCINVWRTVHFNKNTRIGEGY